ncbi:hemerythrin domain-containing protein [Desulfobacca acetoxidans]|nr:cation-binding protein [Desulfobacterales bacterium]
MLPIDPLMLEHRLIERMTRLIHQEMVRIRDNIAVDVGFAFVDQRFLDAAVDFHNHYVNRLHHGKEEGILFAALAEKPLSTGHLRMMKELQQEHIWGRQTTTNLEVASKQYNEGCLEILPDLLNSLGTLADFYSQHIAKEDRHFFLPAMEYFTREEKEVILSQMADLDRGFALAKYQKLVADWEASGCKCHL